MDLQKQIPWEKVPFVPRPALIADPVTAFGKTKNRHDVAAVAAIRRSATPSILEPRNKAAIKPDRRVLEAPIKPYVSAREKNRERILNMVDRYFTTVENGGPIASGTSNNSIDVILPQRHRSIVEQTYHRRPFFYEPTKYVH